MEPALQRGDKVAISSAPSTLKDGMVVVVKEPPGWLPGHRSGELIDRIIGLGGETVGCNPRLQHGKVVVNGVALDETARLPAGTKPCTFGAFQVVVPTGHMWLMGDNRDDAADSRTHAADPGHGFVDQKLVTGYITQSTLQNLANKR